METPQKDEGIFFFRHLVTVKLCTTQKRLHIKILSVLKAIVQITCLIYNCWLCADSLGMVKMAWGTHMHAPTCHYHQTYMVSA